jgi:hypothetical protein
MNVINSAPEFNSSVTPQSVFLKQNLIYTIPPFFDYQGESITLSILCPAVTFITCNQTHILASPVDISLIDTTYNV